MTDDEPPVLLSQRGRLGLIVLNRPRAINALTHAMVLEIAAALDRWEHDDQIATIAITGAGDRGLCAGGDIVSLYEDATKGDGLVAAEFWFDEYHLNARIARYPKPVVAIQDGLVLGGGIGISAHAAFRVVTDRGRLGLPEVGIGFVPDVGATWLLSRAPGRLGLFVALTAATLGAADAIAVGLSDTLIPSARIPRLLTALETTDPGEAVMLLATDAGHSPLNEARSWIDPGFDAPTVPLIIDRLRASGILAAEAAADTIESKSPTATAVALEALRRGAALDSLERALDQEFRVSRHALAWPDFAEGVRAQVIDKDRSPVWRPAAHTVTPDQVASFFEQHGDRELGLATAAKGARP